MILGGGGGCAVGGAGWDKSGWFGVVTKYFGTSRLVHSPRLGPKVQIRESLYFNPPIFSCL